MFNSLLVSLVLVFGVIQISCLSTLEAQTQQKESNHAIVRKIEPVTGTEIKLVTESFNVPDASLESIMTLAAPEIWFIYPCKDMSEEQCSQNNLMATIPPDSQKLISKYWKQSLKFKYKYLVEKFTDGNAEIKESMKFSRISSKFSEELKEVDIDSPEGSRQISIEEADKITKLLNITAAEIINKMK